MLWLFLNPTVNANIKSIYKAFVYFGKKVQVDVYKSNGNYSADDSKYI